MADGYVRVPPDSSGKYIDTTEKYNANNVLVERQRVEIPDEVQVSGEWLTRILVEQRVQNLLLAEGLKITDDVEVLRDELSDIAGLTVPTVRDLLTENRTYYVNATIGSDANDGLTSATPWLTPTTALVYISQLDFNSFTVTLKFAAGTYPETYISPWLGGGSLSLVGDTTTPANVIIDCSVGNGGIHSINPLPGSVSVDGFTFGGATPVFGILMENVGGQLIYLGSHIVFGGSAAGYIHITVTGEAILSIPDISYTISKGATSAHYSVSNGGQILLGSGICIVSGTPAFGKFADCSTLATILSYGGGTFSGAATGTRYSATLNAVINTSGGGANYFPGDVAGATATGGQYA